MSAYVVSRRHIEVLTNALLHYGIVPYSTDRGTTELRLGQQLWEENITSVLSRYQDCTREDMPGPCEEDFVYRRAMSSDILPYLREAWSILSLTCGYQSQACEHGGWEGSEAWTYTEALKAEGLRQLGLKDMEQARRRPEWDKAPWSLY